MKILLINDFATPTGGAELLVLRLREVLRRLGHDARLLAGSARPLGSESLADFICYGTTSRFSTVLQTVNPFACWKLRRVLAEFQPDVVHVNLFLTQLSPFILPLLKNIPSLYHVHWYRPVCPMGNKLLPDGTPCRDSPGTACYRHGCLPLHSWVLLMGQMRLWKHWKNTFKLIIANSRAVQRELAAEGIEPAEVVFYGVPEQPMRPPLTSPPIVVCAGRMVWEKGMDVLLQAFATVVSQIPTARLILAGDGPQREPLTKLMTDLKLSPFVSLPGFLPRSEMEERFAGAWVQAVPSRWAEPFGMVAVEAMMRGTAVVASQSGGLAEIIQEARTGFLVPPNDAGALAEALIRLLENRDLADNLGHSGREQALAHFTEKQYVENIVRLYERLLCRHHPNSP